MRMCPKFEFPWGLQSCGKKGSWSRNKKSTERKKKNQDVKQTLQESKSEENGRVCA